VREVFDAEVQGRDWPGWGMFGFIRRREWSLVLNERGYRFIGRGRHLVWMLLRGNITTSNK